MSVRGRLTALEQLAGSGTCPACGGGVDRFGRAVTRLPEPVEPVEFTIDTQPHELDPDAPPDVCPVCGRVLVLRFTFDISRPGSREDDE